MRFHALLLSIPFLAGCASAPVTVANRDAVVARAVDRRKQDFRNCFAVEVDPTTGLEGTLLTEFILGPDGRAHQARVVRSTMDHLRLESCVIHTLEKIPFAKTLEDQPVPATHTFRFPM